MGQALASHQLPLLQSELSTAYLTFLSFLLTDASTYLRYPRVSHWTRTPFV